MDFLENQVRADELKVILKIRVVPSNVEQSVHSLCKVLSGCPAGFSLAGVTYDLMKYIKSISTLINLPVEEVSNLVRILISGFSITFRPNPKDVIEALGNVIKSGSSNAITPLVDLLHSCLRTQQGNPKNNFLTVADEFIPLIAQLSDQDIDSSKDCISRVIADMFESGSNMTCVSQYLSSRPDESAGSASIGKKRKSSGQSNEIYVSHLFEKMSSNHRIATIVFQEFIQRKRRSSDSTQSPSDDQSIALPEASGDKEEFLFFIALLNRSSDVEAKIELWKCMSKLRVYKLRDDFGDEHKSELRKFLESSSDNSIPEDLRWRSLATVLSVDPVNFTEEVCTRVWQLLLEGDRVSQDLSMCLAGLFRSFAVKGSLAELVTTIYDESSRNNANLMNAVDLQSIFQQHEELRTAISASDLIDCLLFLLPKASEVDCARSLAIPLMLYGCERIPENLLSKTWGLLTEQLEAINLQYSDAKKLRRSQLSSLMLSIVDGLRKVSVAWAFPSLTSVADNAVIEETLTLIAKKDSSHRCAALLRLALVCGVDVVVADLIACSAHENQITSFIAGSSLNGHCLVNRFRADPDFEKLVSIISKIVTVNNFKSFPDAVVVESIFASGAKPRMDLAALSVGSDLESLIAKSAQVLREFPRLIFTPISLRRSTFPTEIIAVEAAWANRADSDTISSLAQEFLSSPSDHLLYSLSVVIEEVRRNHAKPQTIVSVGIVMKILQCMQSQSLLAQGRFVIAVHSLVGLDTRTTCELLLSLSYELLIHDTRDRTAIDAAYFCLFQGLVTGKDRRKIRLPWWTNKLVTVIVAIRGLIGCCLSATEESAKIEAAHYVVRVWKTILDGLSSEKFYRISKSIPTLAGEYIRLSGRITSAECASVLDRGCCALLDKLNENEKNYLHAMLGKTDRETLKRLNELLERNYKYKGKI